MKSEADLRKELTRLVEGLGGHVSNIESHRSSAGIPDCNLYVGGVDLWVELKCVSPDSQIKMRPTQRQWHLSRWDAEGVSWVLTLHPETEELWLTPGNTAAQLPPNVGAWYRQSLLFPRGSLHTVLLKMMEYTRNEQKRASDRYGAQENPRGPGAALPPSGANVGEYHWLSDKS